MVIQNTESTLAAALGVSGTLSPRLGLFPITPLTMIWRRMFTPADALLSAVTTQAGSALAERTIAVNEGQWVTLDASGNAIVAPNGTTLPAWPVWSGGQRLDPKGGITVLHGAWVADTSYFVDTGTYGVGTPLIIATGSVQGVGAQTGALEDTTVTADATTLFPVVARVERTPFGVSSETPNGTMRIRAVL
jgi:hypothetical protein